MSNIRLRPKQGEIDAYRITGNLMDNQNDWPDWMSAMHRADQPMEDGSLKVNTWVNETGGTIRVGLHTHVEVGVPGQYLIRDENQNIGVASAGKLFDMFDPVDPDDMPPVDKGILSPADGGPGGDTDTAKLKVV